MKGIVLYNQSFPVIKEDEEAIKENISRILLTLPGERVCNPSFGSKFKLFLFDLDTAMQQDVQREIKTSIARWEPRISINNITTKNISPSLYVLSLECIMLDTLEVFDYERLIKL